MSVNISSSQGAESMSKEHYITISDDIRRKVLKGDAAGLAVYLEIKSRIGVHDKTWVSYQTISDSIGLSVSTVKRAINRLRDENVISAELRNGKTLLISIGTEVKMNSVKIDRGQNELGTEVKMSSHRGQNELRSILNKKTNIYTKSDENQNHRLSEKITVRDYSPSPKVIQWAKKTYPNLDIKNVFYDFQAWNSGRTSYQAWEMMFTGYVKKIAILAKVPMRTAV